jgi:hypothetical protein
VPATGRHALGEHVSRYLLRIFDDALERFGKAAPKSCGEILPPVMSSAPPTTERMPNRAEDWG